MEHSSAPWLSPQISHNPPPAPCGSARSGEAQWVTVGQLPHLRRRQTEGASRPTNCSPSSSVSCYVRQKRTYKAVFTCVPEQKAVSSNLRRLLARTKTIEELITDLLFADDCALLAHTEEALQHIVDRFSDAAKNFGLAISLKKTEVLYQPSPRQSSSHQHRWHQPKRSGTLHLPG